MDELAEDSPPNPLIDVPEVRDGPPRLRGQIPSLLEVPDRQLVQDVLLALEEAQELEVRLRSVADDGRGASPEDLPALGAAIWEEPEAPIFSALCGNFPEPAPGDAIHKVGGQGLVVEAGGSNGHVGAPPGDVPQTPAAHVPGAEVLEVGVNALGSLILASTVSGP